MKIHAVVKVSRVGRGMAVFKNGKSAVVEKGVLIACEEHPQYRGVAKPRRSCASCLLLFALRNQPDGPRISRSPYDHVLSSIDFSYACAGLV